MRGDFGFSIGAHAFDAVGVPEDVFDLDGALVDLHLDAIDLGPQLGDVLPVDVHLQPAWGRAYLCSF